MIIVANARRKATDHPMSSLIDADALTLYHIAPSRSSIVLWMLEELGEPYTLEVLDGRSGETRQAEFLAINPMGKVPALRHHGVVMTETAAILCYLADTFPEAGLSIPQGDPRRGLYLKWLFFLPGSLEPAILDRVFERPQVRREALGYGDFETTIDVVAAALADGPYLLGEPFTAADIAIGSSLRWGTMMGAIPRRPIFSAYIERLEQRPAHRRAAAQDEALGGSPSSA